MENIKKTGGWALAFLLWLWTVVPKAMDWVGRSTLPEDWEQLMADKLPIWAAWLFSTPWWVPALLATLLTACMIWVSWPRQYTAANAIVPQQPDPNDYKIDPWVADGTPTFVELHLVMDEFRCKEVSSSNVYDATTSLIGDDKTQLEILVVFDRWIVSRNAAITCDNRLDGYRTTIQKITDRYLICRVLKVGSPAVIRIDFN